MPEDDDFFMTQELFSQMVEEDTPVTWKHCVDSFFLNGTDRSGTMSLFDLVYEEYKGGEILWAKSKFRIKCDWGFKLWSKFIKRRENKRNETN